MASLEKRQQRVRNGSRRKRDLEAVAPRIDFGEWVAEHLPDEHFPFAVVAAQCEYLKRPGRMRRLPTVDEVRRRLRATGRDKDSLGEVAIAAHFGYSGATA